MSKKKSQAKKPLRRLVPLIVLTAAIDALESLVGDIQANGINSTGDDWPDLLVTYYAARHALRELDLSDKYPPLEWVVLDEESDEVLRLGKEEFASAEAILKEVETGRFNYSNVSVQLVAEQESPDTEQGG